MLCAPLSRFLSLFAAAVPVSAASATVIYQSRLANPVAIFNISEPDESSSFMELPGTGREFDSRVGDQITLAGTDRFVTRFAIRLWAFNNGQILNEIRADTELTLYQNNAGMPGAVIWSGTIPQVLLNAPLTSQQVEVNFTPNILVPDSICFAVAFPSITHVAGDNRLFGVVSAGDPSIGSSPVTVLKQLSADGSWYLEDDSTLAQGRLKNLDVVVEATAPCPGSLVAVVVPCGVMAMRRRRLV